MKSSLRLEALLEALGGGEVTLRLAALTMHTDGRGRLAARHVDISGADEIKF